MRTRFQTGRRITTAQQVPVLLEPRYKQLGETITKIHTAEKRVTGCWWAIKNALFKYRKDVPGKTEGLMSKSHGIDAMVQAPLAIILKSGRTRGNIQQYGRGKCPCSNSSFGCPVHGRHPFVHGLEHSPCRQGHLRLCHHGHIQDLYSSATTCFLRSSPHNKNNLTNFF
jgi:hypothetical protein